MKSKYLFIICLLFLLNSCKLNAKYYNRPEDITKGVAIINIFFKLLSIKDYEKLNAMESDSLKIIAGNDGAEKWAIQNNINYGEFLRFNIIDQTTEYLEGNISKITYVFKIKEVYVKGVIIEDIGLEKINNEDIKLISVNTEN